MFKGKAYKPIAIIIIICMCLCSLFNWHVKVNAADDTYEYVIEVTPAECTLALRQGGQTIVPESSEEGRFVFSLSDGSYSYRITAFGYDTKNGVVNIEGKGGNEEVTLTQKKGCEVTYNITADAGSFAGNDPQVLIYNAGTLIRTLTAKTGYTTSLPKGEYSYRVKADHFAIIEEKSFNVSDQALEFSEVMSPSEAWNGENIDTDWYYSNTDATDYNISLPTELAGLAYLVNEGIESFTGKSIHLQSNVNLGGKNWTPIGCIFDNAKQFSGSFFGEGHRIEGFHVDIAAGPVNATAFGLFGYIKGKTDNPLTVSGLELYGEITGTSEYNGYLYTGGLAGNIGGTGVTLSECGCNVSIDITRSLIINEEADSGKSRVQHAGGFAGYVGAKSTVFEKCYTTGDVSVLSYTKQNIDLSRQGMNRTTGWIGGFAGFSNENSLVTYRSCYSLGNINVRTEYYDVNDRLTTSSEGCYVGGMFGSLGMGQVYNCFCTGENNYLTSSTNNQGSGAFAGVTANNENVVFEHAYCLESVSGDVIGNPSAKVKTAPEKVSEGELMILLDGEGTDYKTDEASQFPLLIWQQLSTQDDEPEPIEPSEGESDTDNPSDSDQPNNEQQPTEDLPDDNSEAKSNEPENGDVLEEETAEIADISDEALNWASTNGIIQGYRNGSLGLDTICSRSQFMIMLWRMMGKPKASAEVRFNDVTSDMSSYRAIQWAVENGLIVGYHDGSFRPQNDLTRTQVIVILWRMGGRPIINLGTPFTDINQGSSSYRAIKWAFNSGIMQSIAEEDENLFNPKGNWSREKIVSFLYRYSMDYLN